MKMMMTVVIPLLIRCATIAELATLPRRRVLGCAA